MSLRRNGSNHAGVGTHPSKKRAGLPAAVDLNHPLERSPAREQGDYGQSLRRRAALPGASVATLAAPATTALRSDSRFLNFSHRETHSVAVICDRLVLLLSEQREHETETRCNLQQQPLRMENQIASASPRSIPRSPQRFHTASVDCGRASAPVGATPVRTTAPHLGRLGAPSHGHGGGPEKRLPIRT